MKKVKERSRNSKIFNIIAIGVIILQLLLIFLPFIWGVAQSFKPWSEWIVDKLGFPEKPTTKMYGLFFQEFFEDVDRPNMFTGVVEATRVYFEDALLITFLYAAGNSLAAFIACFITAYILYKFRRFKSSGVFYAIIVIAINLPLAGGTASGLKLYHQLGVYDNILALCILNAHPLQFFFLIFYSSFFAIPNDFFEAAEVDGAGRFRIMVQIALPLVKGVVLLFFLQAFVAAWNNYMTCLMYMPSYPTIGYLLYKYKFKSKPIELNQGAAKLAACFMCALPIIIIFIFFGKKMMQGVSIAGGVKG